MSHHLSMDEHRKLDTCCLMYQLFLLWCQMNPSRILVESLPVPNNFFLRTPCSSSAAPCGLNKYDELFAQVSFVKQRKKKVKLIIRLHCLMLNWYYIFLTLWHVSYLWCCISTKKPRKEDHVCLEHEYNERERSWWVHVHCILRGPIFLLCR